MKLGALVLLAGVAAMGPASGQEFIAPIPEAEEIETIEIEEARPSIEGIVTEIFTTRKPWQLVNPAAPKKYGSGEKMVSKDFGPGTPVHQAGLVVFGVEW
jgi:hypothetical protein